MSRQTNDLMYPSVEEALGRLIPKFARFSVFAASTTEIVAGVSGKRLRIHALIAGCLSAGAFTLYSGATPAFAGFSYANNGQIVVPHNPWGWLVFGQGAGINVHTTAANTVQGVIIYSEDD